MKNFKRFFGPGMLIAVGYMDPGNWATDLSGGARFEYTLLFVILLSNIFAMFLQHAAIRLGATTNMDLAESCKTHFHPVFNYFLWFVCEIAIIAMDLAEVLGTAIALKLLFGIPLSWGIAVTALDVLFILFLFEKNLRFIEIFITSLIFLVLICFGIELYISNPIFSSILSGFVPRSEIVINPEMRWIAIGILGATVMPHNLYLHSNLIKSKVESTKIKEAIKYGTMDSSFSLFIAFFINAAILILAASTFYKYGKTNVSEIEEAYQILNPLMGVGFASILFAIALLASGQNSTITGTMAGQIVMEGFLNWKVKPWVRRLSSRSLAIIPAWILIYLYGDKSTTDLLVLSQVVLSLQLGFAVIPLVYFTSKKSIMGEHTNPLWLQVILWAITIIIVGFNLTLLLNL